MKALVALVVFLSAVLVPAQPYDLYDKVAFVNLTTARAALPGAAEEFAPHVLLRFARQNSSSSFLAMTDEYGTALIPVEAGTYCVTAYGLDGKIASLANYSSGERHRCFTAVPGRTVEFSLALASDAKYGGRIPSLGVK